MVGPAGWAGGSVRRGVELSLPGGASSIGTFLPDVGFEKFVPSGVLGFVHTGLEDTGWQALVLKLVECLGGDFVEPSVIREVLVSLVDHGGVEGILAVLIPRWLCGCPESLTG